MRIVDTNVLLYSVASDAPQHQSARRWLDRALSGSEAIGFAWLVVVGFLRMATHPRVSREPYSFSEAAAIVDRWLAQPPALVIHPSQRHLPIMRGLLAEVGAAGNLVNDAHLAALALEHDATIVSYDRDFERFEGVRREEPGA